MDLNPTGEAFIFDIVANWVAMILMEAFLVVMIEVTKNDFLACTSAMIFMGSNMAFAGFFRRIVDIPVWIRWLCYIVPLKVIALFFWKFFLRFLFFVSGYSMDSQLRFSILNASVFLILILSNIFREI